MKLNKVINLQNKEAMTKTITFNELRRLKDSLPDGSTHRIADELGISVETVILKMAKVVEYILNRDQTEAW
jgi:hypothetical protein